MKAFVIKNKEGKYWCGIDLFSETIDVRKTYICEDFDYISKALNKLSNEGLLKDCELVEITIVENDLEQENKQLKEQLAEKDKEIEKLYKIFDSQQRHIDSIEQHFRGRGTKRTGNVILDFKLQIRKQVCDEIKKVIEYHSEWYEQGYVIDMVTEDLLKEIDKIGEEE